MARGASIAVVLAILLSSSACTAVQERNTALGAGIGTAAGALIGYPGYVVQGAVIGAGAGAAIGYGVSPK